MPSESSVTSTSTFLAACRGEPTERVPVWFMRQAGRSLPEYRELREHNDILAICRSPELAAEVTLQPIRRYDVDAAILFSDIVVPLAAMGVDVDIRPGIGPVVPEPVRDPSGLATLKPFDPATGVPYVLETIRILRAELDVPLIGFAGAPFTLASYLFEGGPSKSHARTKALMYAQPKTWHALMEALADALLAFSLAQVEQGAQAIQIFDSWAGHLSRDDYESYALPATRRIMHGLAGAGVPRILFGVGTGELLASMASSGADVVGVDWRVPLDEARRRTGDAVALQGNLDPATCLAPSEVVKERAADVLERGGGRAHIFNLGHGVLPATDPDILRGLVEFVHSWRQDDRAS
jgi:uroporphyrinogen decarboxylase